MITSPGIYPNIPMAAYLADPCPAAPSLSASVAIRLLRESPLHAYNCHPRLGGAPPENSNVANIGTVAHDLLLHGEGKVRVIRPEDHPAQNGNIPDGWTNKSIREARDSAIAEGLTPILSDDYDGVMRMVDSARGFLSRSELSHIMVDNGRAEHTIIWQEGAHWFRCRPDWLATDGSVMIHVKTTDGSANPAEFIRRVFGPKDYGFAMRFYARGHRAASFGGHVGPVCPQSVCLVIEQNAPYACSLIDLTPAKAAIEDARVERAIALWKRCVGTNTWPGYDGRIHYAEPTAWELAEAEGAIAGPPATTMVPL